MGMFAKLFGSKSAAAIPSPEQQAVLIQLNGADLSQEVYESNDLMTLEDQLTESLDGSDAGELDGNEVGADGATVYLYGVNAEKLFERVEPVIRNYPLCQQATIVIRHGGPGASQREVRI